MPKHNRSQRNYALRYIFGLPLIVLALVAGPVASYAANAVAMVTDLVGKGVIIEEGKEKPCEILSYLPPGAEIRIDQGAKLSLVYFKSSKEYSFSGKAAIKINTGGPSVLSGSNQGTSDVAGALNGAEELDALGEQAIAGHVPVEVFSWRPK